MAEYSIQVRKGRKDTLHPCDGYTVTTVPKEGYYAENSEVIAVPKGQKVKLELDCKEHGKEVILLPKDGQIAFVLNQKGDTITSYPKKRDRQIRNVSKEDSAHG